MTHTTTSRAFGLFCAVLIVAALAVTLRNTSEFAAWYEPDARLAWAWAIYVDLALAGYTVANVVQARSGVVRIGWYWFIALSVCANVLVILARYDAAREATLMREVLQSTPYMLASGVLYGVSIPISVFAFAHTMADAFRPAQQAQPMRTTPLRALTVLGKRLDEIPRGEVRIPALLTDDSGVPLEEPSLAERVRAYLAAHVGDSNRKAARELRVSETTVRKYRKEGEGA